MGLIWKIALGIVLGSFLLFLGRVIVLWYAVGIVAESADEIAETANEFADRQQERIRERECLRIEAERRKREQQQAVARQRQLAQLRAQQKDQAWMRWYQEPKGCDDWESEKHMVECINHKMRAKKEFERLWDQGKVSGRRT